MLPQTMSSANIGGHWRLWVIDLPIFFATTVSIATFYICAQRHLNPKGWMRDMLLLPMLLALAIGMSVNNARAVLEALFNHQSAFNRTPKYGSNSRPARTRRASYLPLASLLPIIEIIFAVYFAFCTWHAIVLAQWTSVPFILLFFIGFSYVASKSVGFWLQRWVNIERAPSAAAPAS
jgi:hypothetical protein